MKSSTLNLAGIGIWCTAVVAGVVACGGGGGDPGGQGTLRVALTDAPACGFDHVYVTVDKVRVHQSASAGDGEAGWTDLAVTPPRRVDLLALTNGILEELGSVPLAAGHYSQVRLVLADNVTGAATPANAVQPTGGSLVALNTPSGQQSGLKLQAHFEVGSGQLADLVLDFDACKSIVRAGGSGQYNLKPVMSVVPRAASSIQGVVTTTLSLSSTTVAAQQAGATLRSTTPDASGNFSLPFLAPGTYTLVITSEGRATGVVTSVPAGTGTTAVSTAATAITLPTSSMAEVTGTVSASTLSGGSTVTAPVTDATVRAMQAVAGETVEVRSQPADAVLGSYNLRLPTAAPVRAAYAASAPLAFTADSAAAGKYTMQSQAPNRAVLSKPADISSGTGTQVNFGY
ncbi:DUF4382 domain-containing protein [Ramlibacter solisilvae]|uniref:DUF4382 domain-containing protein n=1 Tax=Ramlibacter tataouinensis TaxID=94132 RepID=A0A127JWL3_9BURK|nr:DUF4382 domain-containing protein [Ramlibacter tataouinensis]AMO22422.1 hypothetical protein UC35_05295 [Ramlibacter tataouinensis]